MSSCAKDSILLSIKKMLGICDDYNAFDQDIIIHINSVFMILNQLGVGPVGQCFMITGESESWEDFLKDNQKIELVKSYMYLKVRLIFDPPSTGVLHEAMERQISEFEWRLSVQVDPGVEKILFEPTNNEEEDADGSVCGC